MASQREYESIIWFALLCAFEDMTAEDLYEYFYSSANVPTTQAQHKRFESAMQKVMGQMKRFQGDERL